MSQLRKSKEIWSGKDEEVGLGIAKGGAKKTMTDERATMLEEQGMLKQRADAMANADERAAEGAERKLKREDADMMRLRKKCVMLLDTARRRRRRRRCCCRRRAPPTNTAPLPLSPVPAPVPVPARLWEESRQAKKELYGAHALQKLYRGHIGRKGAAKWAMRRAELDAMRALKLAASITVERVYRGRLGRYRAESRRIELAEFIASIRSEEAQEEEEQFWRTHPFARWGRDARQLWEKVRFGEAQNKGVPAQSKLG